MAVASTSQDAAEVVLLADSRYTIQARRQAPASRLFEAYGKLSDRWAEIVGSVGARRVGVDDHHRAAGRGHPCHLAKRRSAIGKILQPLLAEVDVMGRIGEGHRGGVCRKSLG